MDDATRLKGAYVLVGFRGVDPYENPHKLPIYIYMGGCQNSGPFLGTLNIRCRTIIGIQKGTIISKTTHIMVPILTSPFPLVHQ